MGVGVKYREMALIGLAIVAGHIEKHHIPCASYDGRIATLAFGKVRYTWAYEGKGKVYVVRVFHMFPEGVRHYEDYELGSNKKDAEAALWQLQAEALDWMRDNTAQHD